MFVSSNIYFRIWEGLNSLLEHCYNMKIHKNIIKVGNSRAIIIPDIWLNNIEKELDVTITTAILSINRNSLIIHPLVFGIPYSKSNFHDLIRNRDRECKKCGSKNNLEVHHIDYNKRNNDLKNLLLLCRKCHRKLHRGPRRKRKKERKCQQKWCINRDENIICEYYNKDKNKCELKKP